MLERIKNFIKEEWKILLLLIGVYFVFTYQFPYVVYTPGGAINMSERIEGKNLNSEDGSINMTYVSMIKGTIPYLALAQIVPDWDVVKSDNITYDDTDFDETVEIDKIYMQEAISNAENVAYQNASIDYKKTKTHNVVTYVNEDAKTNLKYGDEILSIDGQEYEGLSEFQKYISSKSVGDKVRIEYLRDDKKHIDEVTLIKLDKTTKVGISIVTIYDYDTPYNISVKTKSSESGPSGGLMTALAIYNSITEHDITKGRTIMGTGTISLDGKVGEIGGVKYKLLGAEREGADVFLCPKENYEEAKKVKEENDIDIEIYGVETFKEAIDYLNK